MDLDSDQMDGLEFEWHREVAAKFERLDLDRLWSLCSARTKRLETFDTELRRVLFRYRSEQRPLPKLSAKQRGKTYDQIEKSARTLRGHLTDMAPSLENELVATFLYHEPEELFEQTVDTEYEGLSYFEYHAFRIMDSISVLLEHLPEARDDHKPQAGRPKQNENLEETIRYLGELFEGASGQPVAERFRYDESDRKAPYQGPFMAFLSAAIWGFNGREFPSNAALGEATRRAFELRK